MYGIDRNYLDFSIEIIEEASKIRGSKKIFYLAEDISTVLKTKLNSAKVCEKYSLNPEFIDIQKKFLNEFKWKYYTWLTSIIALPIILIILTPPASNTESKRDFIIFFTLFLYVVSLSAYIYMKPQIYLRGILKEFLLYKVRKPKKGFKEPIKRRWLLRIFVFFLVIICLKL